MTTTPPLRTGQPRRAYRDLSAPIAGGVAAGLAEHLARPGAVGAGLLRGDRVPRRLRPPALRRAVGVPARRPALRRRARPGWRAPAAPAGVPGGARGCATPDRRSRSARCSSAWCSASRAIFGQGVLFWPVVLGVAGIALLWRQADEAQRERWLDSSGRIDPFRAVFGNGGWAAYARVAVGLGLVVVALVVFAVTTGPATFAVPVLVAGLLGLVGPRHRRRPVGAAPGQRPRRRARRADPHPGARRHGRAPARLGAADAGADPEERRRRHHGRPAGPRRRSATCARGSSRPRPPTRPRSPARCRRWPPPSSRRTRWSSTWSPSATARSTRRCARSSTPPGRRSSTSPSTPASSASTSTPRPPPGAVEVFVRDRGAGFDLDAVASDRHGVRSSIMDRMARHGGRADVRSPPARAPRSACTCPAPRFPGHAHEESR